MRRRPITLLAGAAALPLIALAVAGCGANSSAKPTATSGPPKTASGQTATVGAENEGNLGKVLVDAQGRTLYLFQKDSGPQSACFQGCASIWPPLRVSGKPMTGAGLDASLFGTTPRSDGGAQVTYNGHPLYLFSGDRKPGDTNGEGLTDFGSSWFALSAAGNQVAGHTPTSSGGYGY
jgi:predicted lipoprotein with Yx(FWY)xxD motif